MTTKPTALPELKEREHPEHCWKWTKTEVDFINARVRDYTRAVIAERNELLAENVKLSDLWSAMKTERDGLLEIVKISIDERDHYMRERDQLRDHIHTCGPNCTKAGCVNTRLRKELAELRQIITDPAVIREAFERDCE